MLCADAECCNSFVSVIYFYNAVSLTLKTISKLTNKKRKLMKQIKKLPKNVKSIIVQSIKTLWVIGTSITATAVLSSSLYCQRTN